MKAYNFFLGSQTKAHCFRNSRNNIAEHQQPRSVSCEKRFFLYFPGSENENKEKWNDNDGGTAVHKQKTVYISTDDAC